MRDHFRQFTLVICAQVEKAPLPTGISVGVLIEEDTGEFKKGWFRVYALQSGWVVGYSTTFTMYIVPNMFVNVQLIGHTHTRGETYLSRSKYFHHVEDKMLAEIRCLVYHKQLTLFFICYPR